MASLNYYWKANSSKCLLSLLLLFALNFIGIQPIQAQAASKAKASEQLRKSLKDVRAKTKDQPTTLKNELVSLYNHYQNIEIEDSVWFNFTNDLGSVFYDLNNYDSSLHFLYVAKSIEHKVNLETRVKLYLNLGITFQKDLPLDSAKHYLDMGLQLAKKLNDKYYLAASYANLGNYYLGLYDYTKAYETYNKALEMFEADGNNKQAAIVKANIGMILQNLGRGKEAISIIEEATLYHEKEGNIINMLINYGNLAIYYKEEKDYEKALEYTKKAISLARKNDMSSELARLYYNAGNLLKDMKDYREAESNYLSSLEICQKNGLSFGVMINQHALGVLYQILNRPDEALPWLNLALQSAIQSGDLNVLKNIYNVLYMVNQQKKNYADALHFHKLYSKYNDSLQQLENKQFILDLEGKYQLEKKNSENKQLKEENERKAEVIRLTKMFNIAMITLVVIMGILIMYMVRSRKKINKLNHNLQELNDEISSKNQTLQELNNTKDKVFSIIGHDLRSPFNALLGLLQLLIDEKDGITEEERQHSLRSTLQHSKTTYALLENLLTWSMSQRNAIKFNPMIQLLYPVLEDEIEFLNSRASEKNIKIVNEIQPDQNAWFDHQMAAIMFRNIINNAIKFSEPKKSISITSKVDAELIHITIADEGKGMSETELALIRDKHSFYSTNGTQQEKGTGLGLLIVKDFIKHNQAILNIESEVGKGSSFTLSFRRNAPIAEHF